MLDRQEQIIGELGFETHKRKTTQPRTPTQVQGRDLFQTPNYAVDLLIPFLPHYVTYVWEPASGDGKIARRLLEKTDLDLYVSDIRESMVMPNEIRNFLIEGWPEVPFSGHGMIITNPPFSLKEQFYKRCRFHELPFALLIDGVYSGWVIRALMEGAEKIIPTRRIDYITPSGKSGATGQSADFHSIWLTWGFGLGKTETFVELTNKEKKENI